MEYNVYVNLYGEMPEQDFNRISWEASRYLDRVTTTVDGFSKLREAYPSDEHTIECIERCIAKIVNLRYKIENIENSTGYTKMEDGSVLPTNISSISSGSESVSYSIGKSELVNAVADKAVRDNMCYEIVKEYLSGLCDKNGVNLLYTGVYPYVR